VLVELRLKDWALVEDARVELAEGLNVVTGETGAGKSLLVGALGAILGDRAHADMVRAGASRAEVEALFEVGDDPGVGERLRAAGHPVEAELVVRRVVEPGGRSRAYLNGRLVVGSTLREVTRGLAEITSQHEHHRLADPASHLDLLDVHAGVAEERRTMAAAYERLRLAMRDLGSADRTEEERSAREDLLRFQLREIESADPQTGEIETLTAKRERLRYAGRIQEAAAVAEEALYARDASVCGELARREASLGALGHLDPRLDEAFRRIRTARVDLEDVARDLGRIAAATEADPEALSALEDRLATLSRLARKHGGDMEAVLAARTRIAEEIGSLDRHEERLSSLSAARDAALEEAGAVARVLSLRRREAAVSLGRHISAELAELGMGDARVEVEVTRSGATAELQEAPGVPGVDGARLGPTGLDRAEILIAPNPGEPARPLRRIASGGELSRALLAIKAVGTGFGPSDTYVFDEVDAGVGGATAEVVGRKLERIAMNHQVICVTHLPQVASLARRHFVVAKKSSGARTTSEVRALSERERGAEIARMLGGVQVTRKTRAAAAEMIRLARRAVS